MNGIEPKVSAAFTTGTAAPGFIRWSEPIGARNTGIRIGMPSTVVVASTSATSLRTRGRKAMVSRARRLRRSVVSDSAPPDR